MRAVFIFLSILICGAIQAQSEPEVNNASFNSSLIIGIIIAVVVLIVIFFLLRKDSK